MNPAAHAAVRALLWGMLVLLPVALVGCASAPIQEMSDARRALSSARQAGAEQWVEGGLARAEQEMDSAGEALAAGDYKAARAAATSAKTQAIAVRALALELTELEQAVAAAERAGRDVGEVRAIAERAERAARAGLVTEAGVLVETALQHPQLRRPAPGS